MYNAALTARKARLRRAITRGKNASLDIKIGAYANLTSADFAAAADMGISFDDFFDGYPALDALKATRAAGYRAARDLRALTGRATLADVASYTMVPTFSANPYLVNAYGDADADTDTMADIDA